MKMFSVTPVVCSRGGSFDAEIVFKEEDYSRDGESCKTTQKLIEARFTTRDGAMARAKAECEYVEGIIRSHAVDYLAKYRESIQYSSF